MPYTSRSKMLIQETFQFNLFLWRHCIQFGGEEFSIGYKVNCMVPFPVFWQFVKRLLGKYFVETSIGLWDTLLQGFGSFRLFAFFCELLRDGRCGLYMRGKLVFPSFLSLSVLSLSCYVSDTTFTGTAI